jgi:acetyl-CoA carboxylase alpha subunit
MSSKPMIQDGEEVRQMTAKEYAEYQKLQTEVATFEAAQIAKAATRQAALDKLGLTADEVQALFG